MRKKLLYPVGCTPACRHAARLLADSGIPLTDHPSPEVTHLLLDVPSFRSPGVLQDGTSLSSLLATLPEDIQILGGNLSDPCLTSYSCQDLLKDETYLCANAAITADCALAIAAGHNTTVWRDTPTLILGWGRIGKCLERRLSALRAPVTVLARRPSDRAMLRAFGTEAICPEALPEELPRFRLILNTAPEPVIPEAMAPACRNSLKIDLASRPGILTDSVIQARGLPGRMAPESSGRLIAGTIRSLWKEEQL